MPPRNNIPPSASRHSPSGIRGAGRGGIQKHRTGAPKVDKDGDLLMGAADGTDIKPSGKRRRQGNRLSMGLGPTREGGGGGSSRISLTSSPAKQAMLRGLGSQQVNMLDSRIGHVTQSSSNKGRRHATVGNSQNLLIRGLKDSKAASHRDGGLKDLVAFLERKASGLDAAPQRGVRIKKSWIEGDDTIVTASAEDATWVLKLDTFKFAGAPLTIQRQEPSSPKDHVDMSQEATKTQDRIREILNTRYDVDLKLLNLSALGKDSGLVEMGMFDAQNRISKLFPVLMVVCDRLFTSAQHKREAVVSVTLAENELDDISNVTTLAQTFPEIQNLDLSKNHIRDLQALEGWRWRFRRLQNLKIDDNPIEITSPNYKEEIARWYPSLQILNDTRIRSPDEVAIAVERAFQPHKASQISPIPIAGPDFRDVNQIAEAFLRQFFPLYDTDRIALADLFYDEQSTHSISINTSAPRAGSEATIAFSWASYIKQSRNLLKVTTINGRLSRTYQGLESIKSLWHELPHTHHPDPATQTAQYLVDCHPVLGLPDPNAALSSGVTGLILMIHGEFDEKRVADPKAAARSFSRTFVLGPGLHDTSPIRVISDALILRTWSSLASVGREEVAQSTGAGYSSRSGQEDILTQLVLHTQMTPEYATMCLAETEWDLEKALNAFEVNKAKLPPTAFVRNTQSN
ncbi:MAG: nuclear mRNA export, poly(A)+RNA binding protein [Claussenomyces sp. TS43310]|nr:MAG: nuclear mRNA export, poly(A)+RNA binding protein [Claussenomyces sp. TS43310]